MVQNKNLEAMTYKKGDAYNKAREKRALINPDGKPSYEKS